MVNVNFKSTVRISLDINPSRYQANWHIAHEYFIMINTSYLIICRCFYAYHSWSSLVGYVIIHENNLILKRYFNFMFYVHICEAVKILFICNFYPSRARNYATTIISKLNNFAEVLAVRMHVDVYMATPALRSLTHETLCDTGQRTADSGHVEIYQPPPTHHQIPPL